MNLSSPHPARRLSGPRTPSPPAARRAGLATSWLLAASSLVTAGCSSDPVIDARTVTLHAPRACAVPDDAYVLLHAAGDFQPTAANPPEQGFLVQTLGLTLDHLPAATRQLVADVSSPSSADARFRGVSLLVDSGPADVLLWPAGRTCQLSSSVGGREGASLATLDGRYVLVTGGVGNPVPSSALFDLATGEARTVTPDLLRPRRDASVTALPGPSTTIALVAGGLGEDGALLDSAEVFDRAGEAFVGDPITLSAARASHGALALASGEALLVGGRGTNGPLGSLEAVDPFTRRARTAGLATLAVPRIGPTVLRLASGEILVAGGVDASGAPVTTLEWLSADATRAVRVPRELVGSHARAFVALPAGGALAVVAPEDAAHPVHDVWVIGDGGSIDAGADIAGVLGDVRLFGGGAAPLLWTGDRWLRWDGWRASFAPLFEATGAPGPAKAAPLLAPDPGLAMWLDGDHLAGLRYDATGPFESFPGSLLHVDEAHLSPDRAPEPAGMRFDASLGLVLPPATSAFVDDATFADVTLDLTTAPGLAPLVVFRDPQTSIEHVVGGAGCTIAAAEKKLHLERHGAALLVGVDDGAMHACQVPLGASERLAVGVRGASSPPGSVVKDLTITRE